MHCKSHCVQYANGGSGNGATGYHILPYTGTNCLTMHPQDPQDLLNFVYKTKRFNNMTNLLVSSLTLVIFMIFGDILLVPLGTFWF